MQVARSRVSPYIAPTAFVCGGQSLEKYVQITKKHIKLNTYRSLFCKRRGDMKLAVGWLSCV